MENNGNTARKETKSMFFHLVYKNMINLYDSAVCELFEI